MGNIKLPYVSGISVTHLILRLVRIQHLLDVGCNCLTLGYNQLPRINHSLGWGDIVHCLLVQQFRILLAEGKVGMYKLVYSVQCQKRIRIVLRHIYENVVLYVLPCRGYRIKV